MPTGTIIYGSTNDMISAGADGHLTLSALFEADPLSGNASALSFDVHIVMNSLGSNTEYSKT